MNTKELLDLKLWGDSTLRHVLSSHLQEGQFFSNYLDMDEVETERFFDSMAGKIIEAVNGRKDP
jgi:hypothetical protein